MIRIVLRVRQIGFEKSYRLFVFQELLNIFIAWCQYKKILHDSTSRPLDSVKSWNPFRQVFYCIVPDNAIQCHGDGLFAIVSHPKLWCKYPRQTPLQLCYLAVDLGPLLVVVHRRLQSHA